jgi:hypothetical protein
MFSRSDIVLDLQSGAKADVILAHTGHSERSEESRSFAALSMTQEFCRMTVPGQRFGLSRVGCFRLLCQGGKRFFLVHSQISQNPAINLDVLLFQAIDHTAVRQATLAGCSVDTLNPQGSEHSLLNFAVAVCVLTGLGDRLLGNAEDAGTRTVITLGGLKDFFMTSTCNDAAFYSWHLESPKYEFFLSSVPFRKNNFAVGRRLSPLRGKVASIA